MAEISGVQHQSRRALVLSTFVGSTGENTADMTSMRLALADGVTAGGWPMQKAGLTPVSTTTAFTYNVQASDATVLLQTNLNPPDVFLPLTANYPAGQKLMIGDANGNASVNNFTIRTNTSTEKIVGVNSLGTTVSSTSLTTTTNGLVCTLTPLSTIGVWAFWIG